MQNPENNVVLPEQKSAIQKLLELNANHAPQAGSNTVGQTDTSRVIFNFDPGVDENGQLRANMFTLEMMAEAVMLPGFPEELYTGSLRPDRHSRVRDFSQVNPISHGLRHLMEARGDGTPAYVFVREVFVKDISSEQRERRQPVAFVTMVAGEPEEIFFLDRNMIGFWNTFTRNAVNKQNDGTRERPAHMKKQDIINLVVRFASNNSSGASNSNSSGSNQQSGSATGGMRTAAFPQIASEHTNQAQREQQEAAGEHDAGSGGDRQRVA